MTFTAVSQTAWPPSYNPWLTMRLLDSPRRSRKGQAAASEQAFLCKMWNRPLALNGPNEKKKNTYREMWRLFLKLSASFDIFSGEHLEWWGWGAGLVCVQNDRSKLFQVNWLLFSQLKKKIAFSWSNNKTLVDREPMRSADTELESKVCALPVFRRTCPRGSFCSKSDKRATLPSGGRNVHCCKPTGSVNGRACNVSIYSRMRAFAKCTCYWEAYNNHS